MDESSGTITTVIDELYEFSAPRFFDFVKGESEEDMKKAELWFETASTYAPSPFMVRIKAGNRSFRVESLCNFSESEQIQKVSEHATASNSTLEEKAQADPLPDKKKEEEVKPEAGVEMSQIVTQTADDDKNKEKLATVCAKENGSDPTDRVPSTVSGDKENSQSLVQVETESCTPKPLVNLQKKLVSDQKRQQTAKKIASMLRNPSALKPKNQLLSSTGTANFALENQAVKRQKLDGGRSRQILNVKPHNLPHKSNLGISSGKSNLCSSTANKLERKIYVREPAVPFVSMAEMMKKFQSSTRDVPIPQSSVSHVKPKLKLTRPKEPEFETSQRLRSVKVKSTAELEEEMMAKLPKFKAKPLNKKIFNAPTLPALPRSTPKPPEFQEFHFETMARANHNAETSSVASTEASRQNTQWKPHFTESKTPVLQTSIRARPPKVKSSIELEQEEMEKAPKFKAKPLNKKIFESKGSLGIFCNAKKQGTVPQEFHFATNERIPPAALVVDLFDKLSLKSEPNDPIPRNTIPNPFRLQTEERGAEKERKFVMEFIGKRVEEERARVPKANPYPYTTDYPVVPPKPEPKQCTKPEPFQLESLMRHEEEMQREMEEKQRREKEEAQMRIFKAQPVLKEDPVPVQEKVRKPLTQVQEFNLHADHRAVDRAEFNQKVKEKEMMYKRYREESEAAKMIEEEKALKQLRRTMVPHARSVPKFDHPFYPQKSSKVTTRAKSPNLRVVERKERRKMINSLTAAAASSPATRMR